MAETKTAAPQKPGRNRKKFLGIAAGLFAIIGIGYLAYWFVELRHFEQTTTPMSRAISSRSRRR